MDVLNKNNPNEKLQTSESEKSLNPVEKITNRLRNIYLIFSLVKTFLGLYIIYENKVEILANNDETKKLIFQYIVFYSFLWPIALAFSTLFFVAIHIIDTILQLIKPRNHELNEDLENLKFQTINNFKNFSNSKFFLSTILSIIFIAYLLSIPCVFVLFSNLTKKKLLQKNVIYYRILAFLGLNLFISLFIVSILIYFACFLKIQNKKLEIDEDFLQSIEKKEKEESKNLADSILFTSFIKVSAESSFIGINSGICTNEEIAKIKGNYRRNNKDKSLNKTPTRNIEDYSDSTIVPNPKKSRNDIIDQMRNVYSPKQNIFKQSNDEFELELIEQKYTPKKMSSNKLIKINIPENIKEKWKSTSENPFDRLKVKQEKNKPRTPKIFRKTIII